MPLRRTRGLARTAGRTAIIAGTATAVSGHVAARQQALSAQQGGGPAAPPPESPARAAALDPAVIDQLERFAALRDRGIITEDEFVAQKAKLLST